MEQVFDFEKAEAKKLRGLVGKYLVLDHEGSIIWESQVKDVVPMSNCYGCEFGLCLDNGTCFSLTEEEAKKLLEKKVCRFDDEHTRCVVFNNKSDYEDYLIFSYLEFGAYAKEDDAKNSEI